MSDVVFEAATSADAAAILALLDEAGLTSEGLLEHLPHAIVARKVGRLVGMAALEVYADGALLRSVAVHATERGSGLGHRLTERALSTAQEHQVPAIYLLTLTAERFFPRFGFEQITRADVPASVQESVEFKSACPASAIVMRKHLREPATENR